MSTPDSIIFISVVRDFEMYDRCIRNNANANRHQIVCLDNSIGNKGIPFRYNEFLNSYDFDKPAWFVFCHEDFELKEDITTGLSRLSCDALYGPIGARTKVRFGLYPQWQLIGQIEESNKDGSNCRLTGMPAPVGTPVETFDCQCLILHSSLIHKTGLCFDVNLSFDLYVEDLCIQAKEQYEVPSLIYPFSCRHWSSGKVSGRYYLQEEYLNKKYPYCCYTGTSSHSIGNPGTVRRFSDKLKAEVRHLLLPIAKS